MTSEKEIEEKFNLYNKENEVEKLNLSDLENNKMKKNL